MTNLLKERLPLFGLPVLCMGLAMAVTLSAQPRSYTVLDLGTLGGNRSSAYGLNNRGQVVGHSETSDGSIHAFLYDRGTMIDLGTLGGKDSYAYRINDAGMIVGRAENEAGLYRAFLTRSGISMADIGLLDSTLQMQEFSAALGINMRGHVVGYRHQPGDHMTAHNRVFRFVDTRAEDLGTFGGEDGVVTAINDAGQMAGSFGNDPHADYADRQAFVTSVAGVGVPLGTLGGRISVALDLNEAGQVVGNSQRPGGEYHGFVYTSNALVDIGALPSGKQSFAYGINRVGHVVGAAESGGMLRAVVYRDEVLTDLNTYIPATAGWVLMEARAINDSGQIVGTGVIDGQQHAFLLSTRPGTR